MNLNEDSWKINAFVDGELDLASRLEMEERLRQDEGLRQRVDTLRALADATHEKADRHRAPAALRERMSSLMQAASLTSPHVSPSAAPARMRAAAAGWFSWLGWKPLIASTAFAGVLALTLNVVLLQSSQQDRLMSEAVASHVRSTIGPHLVDVQSSERHTVKPFLSARLGFSPPVEELQLPGSVFVGGRVDYLAGRPVAALVYRQGEHLVNSFVWPDGARDSTPDFAEERGYRIAHWAQGGMHHCVISDVNKEEFRRLVEAVRSTT